MYNQPPMQREWIKRLYADYNDILYSYKIRLLSKPVISISEGKSTLATWNHETRNISVSSHLIRNYPWDIVVEVLKHEIAHQIVDELFHVEDLHGSYFKKACKMIAVSDWVARAYLNPDCAIKTWKDNAKIHQKDKMLEKVEKLLALATSDNEHEALLAMQRVREIYTKYNLQRTVSENPSDDYVYLIIDRKKKRIERFESRICSILTAHFFVEVIMSGRFDAKDLTEYKIIEIMGTRENVLMAEYVYHFLFNKIHYLWKNYKKAGAKSSKSKLSYMMGILEGFSAKLENPANLNLDPDAITALAIYKDKDLDKFYRSRYPRTTAKYYSASTRDNSSYSAGKAEGKSLNLSKAVENRNLSIAGMLK